MQLEYLIVGALWFGVFYYVNKHQISRIESLVSDAEDYTINESQVIIAIQQHLKEFEVEKPVDKAKFVSEMFKALEPHTIIKRAEEIYQNWIYLGIVFIFINGILTIWPDWPSFQTPTLIGVRNQLFLFGLLLALFIPIGTWGLLKRFNELKTSYTKSRF